jgi:hypothetical protein
MQTNTSLQMCVRAQGEALRKLSGVLYEERQLTSHTNKIIDTKNRGENLALRAS